VAVETPAAFATSSIRTGLAIHSYDLKIDGFCKRLHINSILALKLR
jgi:hypothetical protein